jgi:hypothetical protein
MTTIYSKDFIPFVVQTYIYDNINVIVMVYKCNINDLINFGVIFMFPFVTNVNAMEFIHLNVHP